MQKICLGSVLIILCCMLNSCSSSDYLGEPISSPDSHFQIKEYVNKSQNKDSKYYLVQLILEDKGGLVLDTANTHTSGYLPYYIHWFPE